MQPLAVTQAVMIEWSGNDSNCAMILADAIQIKKPRMLRGFWSGYLEYFFAVYLLNFGHVRCLEALGALYNLERNFISFVQRLETVSRDGRKVYEYILAIVLRDKAKPLTVVEPLHYSICHSVSPLLPFEIYPGILHGLVKNTVFHCKMSSP